MSAPFPEAITRDNDLTFLLGPIAGIDPIDAVVKLYPGPTLTGWVASAEDSDVPLGGVSKTFNQIGSTAKFVWSFEASEVNTALNALLAPASGVTKLFAIAKGAGDLRVAIPLLYRAARLLPG